LFAVHGETWRRRLRQCTMPRAYFKNAALCQGTTSVVPKEAIKHRALAPAGLHPQTGKRFLKNAPGSANLVVDCARALP
jgi:hypothetical protein